MMKKFLSPTSVRPKGIGKVVFEDLMTPSSKNTSVDNTSVDNKKSNKKSKNKKNRDSQNRGL